MKKDEDRNMPVGKLTRTDDFLPPPEELVMPSDTVKVTIALSKASVNFFKYQAKRHHTKYQKMIRVLIDKYTARHE